VSDELPNLEAWGGAFWSILRDGLVRHDHTGMIAENPSSGRDSTYPSRNVVHIFTMFTVRGSEDRRALPPYICTPDL